MSARPYRADKGRPRRGRPGRRDRPRRSVAELGHVDHEVRRRTHRRRL